MCIRSLAAELADGRVACTAAGAVVAMYIQVYICPCIDIRICIYTYMHIAREKGGGERERGSEIYVHAFVCLCIGT